MPSTAFARGILIQGNDLGKCNDELRERPDRNACPTLPAPALERMALA
jgi:hypothetical protein